MNMYRYTDERLSRSTSTRIEVYETTRFPGWLAIVWARQARGEWQVYQVYCSRLRAVVHADAYDYASAVSCGGVEDSPWPSGVNRTERRPWVARQRSSLGL